MNSNEAFVGLDLGGTGAKAGVFDRFGKQLGLSRRSYEPVVSAEGYVEIPIEDIYVAARDVVREAVRESGARILAMSVSSQGQTFVSLDAEDRPLHRAIVWYDSRSAKQLERMRKEYLAARGESKDDMPEFNVMNTAFKIMWLKEHFPELMRSARRFLLLPDYIAYRLTGRPVMDSHTASSTSLYVASVSSYDDIALKIAGVERGQMSEVLSPGEPIARVTSSMSSDWGLSSGTLLVTGTNDQYAGAVGAGNFRPGILSETTGTCLALVSLTEKLPDSQPAGLFGGNFLISGLKFALAYCKTAGVVLDWFRRECCHGDDIAVLEKADVPIGCGGLTMIPHFDGMISPSPDPRARGVFAGLTLRHTRAFMYRSILESLAFSLRENIELYKRNGFDFDVIRSIGGGAKSSLLLQMKADVTGMPIERPVVTEAAVLGAAMIAAVGAGEFVSLAEVSRSLYRKSFVFEPDPENHAKYEDAYQRYQRLAECLHEFWTDI